MAVPRSEKRSRRSRAAVQLRWLGGGDLGQWHALRCCVWISQHSGDSVSVRTGAGIKECVLVSSEAGHFQFRTNMGVPMVGEEFSIKVAFGEVRGVPVSMGNPHFVVFVDEFGPGWQGEAAEIGKHHDFKHGINVEFVRVIDSRTIESGFTNAAQARLFRQGRDHARPPVASVASGKTSSPVECAHPAARRGLNGKVLKITYC